MKVTEVKGTVERHFFHVEAKVLYVKLSEDSQIYELRVDPVHNKSIMLTKPLDKVRFHVQNGHLDKWENLTLGTI